MIGMEKAAFPIPAPWKMPTNSRKNAAFVSSASPRPRSGLFSPRPLAGSFAAFPAPPRPANFLRANARDMLNIVTHEPAEPNIPRIRSKRIPRRPVREHPAFGIGKIVDLSTKKSSRRFPEAWPKNIAAGLRPPPAGIRSYRDFFAIAATRFCRAIVFWGSIFKACCSIAMPPVDLSVCARIPPTLAMAFELCPSSSSRHFDIPSMPDRVAPGHKMLLPNSCAR